jgi:hypothetical protein
MWLHDSHPTPQAGQELTLLFAACQRPSPCSGTHTDLQDTKHTRGAAAAPWQSATSARSIRPTNHRSRRNEGPGASAP